MRMLITAVVLLAGCSLIAPFNDRDSSAIDADGDGDTDVDGDADVGSDIDGDPDGDADTDDGEDAEIDEDTGDADSGEETPCVPDCDGRVCGPDSCGGECSPGCSWDTEGCSFDGMCVVIPAAEIWVKIDSGDFSMGSPETEVGRAQVERGAEEVLHNVTLTRRFFILSTEISQARYQMIMGENPSHFHNMEGDSCGDCPVEQATWNNAVEFCNIVSRLESLATCYVCESGLDCFLDNTYETPYECPGYRLPTEAEWEYVARSGTSTATYLGDLTLDPVHVLLDPPCNLNTFTLEIAWTACNVGDSSHSVATLEPNEWGIFDMLGNVWEWVHDGNSEYPTDAAIDPVYNPLGEGRMSRGGAGSLGLSRNRAAFRFDPVPQTYKNGWLGFRVARTAPESLP